MVEGAAKPESAIDRDKWNGKLQNVLTARKGKDKQNMTLKATEIS